MTNLFNELDFRKNKPEKKDDKHSLVKKSVKFSSKKAKSSPLIKSEEEKKEDVNKKNSMMVGTDSVGSFPPRRDLYAYSYDILMSILLLISASGFFYLFYQVVGSDKIEGFWNWVLPLLSISFFITILLIYSITVHVKKILLTTIFLSFTVSLIFALQIWHVLVIILSFLIAYFSVHQMRKALLDSVKINVGNLVRLGVGGIMFSIIFVMCSQYYWMVHDRGILDLMPRFDKVSISEKIINKFLKIEDEENSKKITVDEFLLMSIKNKDENISEESQLNENNSSDDDKSEENGGAIGNFLGSIGIDQDKIKEGAEDKIEGVKNASGEKVDAIAVEAMRKNLSKQLGQELNGDEYIADVFDDMMYEKVAGWFSRNKNGEEKEEKKVSYLALMLTFLLFVSALTLKAILRPILVLSSIGSFWILRKIGAVKVVKVKRETEMIISQSSV